MLSGEIRVNERVTRPASLYASYPLQTSLIPNSFHHYFRQVIRTVIIMQVTTESTRATVARSNDPQGSNCDKYAMTSQPRASAFVGRSGKH